MTVVRIFGGLGNQMFQFIFGEYLRNEFKLDVKYDVSFFSNQEGYIKAGNAERNFDLINVFPKVAEYLDESKIAYLPQGQFVNKILKRLGFIYLSSRFYKYYKDKQFELDTFVDNRLCGNMYFEGYWQNVFYANKIEQFARSIFSIDLPKLTGDDVLDDIVKYESVSLHIRRGDYLKSTIFRSMDMEFIERSLHSLLTKVKHPVVYLFTDDSKWAEEILSNCQDIHPNFHLVRSKSGLEDMLLMSFCKHNIISNSTYSWWASYLNKNIDKVLISPSEWTADGKWNKYIRIALLSGFLELNDN